LPKKARTTSFISASESLSGLLSLNVVTEGVAIGAGSGWLTKTLGVGIDETDKTLAPHASPMPEANDGSAESVGGFSLARDTDTTVSSPTTLCPDTNASSYPRALKASSAASRSSPLSCLGVLSLNV
jgi:hypothetical protein